MFSRATLFLVLRPLPLRGTALQALTGRGKGGEKGPPPPPPSPLSLSSFPHIKPPSLRIMDRSDTWRKHGAVLRANVARTFKNHPQILNLSVKSKYQEPNEKLISLYQAENCISKGVVFHFESIDLCGQKAELGSHISDFLFRFRCYHRNVAQ